MADYRIEGTLGLNTTEFDKALASVESRLQSFIGSFNRLNTARVSSSVDKLNSSFKQTDLATKELSSDTKKLETNNKQLKSSIESLDNSSKKNITTTRQMGLSISNNNKGVISYQKNIQGLTSAMNMLKSATSLFVSMYAYRFADSLMSSASATIKAKSEMEAYFRVLNMGSEEQARFNNMLDKTLSKFPKMNKYQLGETIASLGTEFNLNVDQMQKISDVAPMIVNEYLRAGRSTEEAILAIKDISQGEFLRLSRETGVGKEDIEKAGWNGDNTDLVSLYGALEKVAKARHWDKIAQKATSLTDVMTITENRFGEFATNLTTHITPFITSAFNKIISAVDWLNATWNNLGDNGQFIAQLLIWGGLITGLSLKYKDLIVSLNQYVHSKAAFILGVNEEIAATQGLSAAIAHEAFEQNVAVISEKARTDALYAQIGMKEESTIAETALMMKTQLGTNVENTKRLAIEAEILAEEKGISIAKARELVLEREAVKEMSASKAIASKILGLKAEDVATLGLRRSLALKIAGLDKERLGELVSKQAISLKNKELGKEKVGELSADKGIKAKILGLRGEKLEEYATRDAIIEKGVAEKTEEKNTVGIINKIKAKILGLNAEIVAEDGVTSALFAKMVQAEMAAGATEADAIATVQATGATKLFTAALLTNPVFLGITAGIVAVTAALSVLYFTTKDQTDALHKFNDTLENGQTRVDELKDRMDTYESTIKRLNKRHDEYVAKGKDTTEIDKQINETKQLLKSTTNEQADAEERLARAKEIQAKYDGLVDGSTDRHSKRVEHLAKKYGLLSDTQQKYIDQGYTYEEAKVLEIKEKNAQELEKTLADRDKSYQKHLEEDKKSGKLKYTGSTLQDMNEINKGIALAWYDFNEADSLWGQLSALGQVIKLGFFALIDYIKLYFADWLKWFDDTVNGLKDLGQDLSEWWNNLTGWFDDAKQFDLGKWIRDKFKGLGDLGKETFNEAKIDKWIHEGLGIPRMEDLDNAYEDFKQGLKDKWNGTNDWLESLMPDVSVDGFKEWFGKNIREPAQKMIGDFLKDPLGLESSQYSASKTFDLKNLIKFDIPGIRKWLEDGWNAIFSNVPNIMESAGELWSSLGLGNGRKTVDSVKQGLANLKQMFDNKLKEVTDKLTSIKTTWGNKAYSAARSIYDKIKSGIGDIARIVKDKLDEVVDKIRNAKDDISQAASEAASSITNPFSWIHIPGFSGGTYGYYGAKKPKHSKGNVRLRTSAPVYGGNVGFETLLRTMLTGQGFRRPGSYQYYPNSQKTVQETWDSGAGNCLDGANLIVSLGNMLGLKGHIVTGSWNGTGHAAAMVGGKLYDMTQFQRSGRFRGTSGVHFGSSDNHHYGSNNVNNKELHIHLNMSNSTIYGMDDAESRFRNIAENVFLDYHDDDKAIGV